jgi:hypothetical protein
MTDAIQEYEVSGQLKWRESATRRSQRAHKVKKTEENVNWFD